MSDLRKLCYHSAQDPSLCYKSGGVNLIYKIAPVEVCAIRIPWTPQSYVCVAASTYHELTLNCAWSFTGGSGSVISAPSATSGIRTSELVFKIRPSGGEIFTVTLSEHSPCTASYTEDPGVTCDVFATQPSIVPQYLQGVAIPRDSNSPSFVSIAFTFNSAGVLQNITR